MTLSMPPSPEASLRDTVLRQYTYLFQMAEQLNLSLSQLEAGAAVHTAALTKSAKAEEVQTSAQYLKALIIKTADSVRSELTKLTASLTGTYVAQSDFGTYVQNLSAYLEANPEAVTQYYKFASELQADISRVDAAFNAYEVETGGYIRTGIVRYDGAVPVYGVAVGQNLTTSVVDGETVVDPVAFRAVFTANRLSFFQDELEVAYVSNNKLYIGEVTVLSRMNLGSWIFDTSSGLAIKWGG